jgi:hypothetical protein
VRAAAFACLALAACGGRAEETPEARELVPPLPALPSGARPSGDDAFELALRAEGAVLLWADGRAVRAQRLDLLGGVDGDAATVAEARAVTELVAEGRGRRLAVAWIDGSRAWSALSLDGGRSFGPPADRGPTPLPTGRRGRLALATGPESTGLYLRRPEAPCLHVDGICAQVERTGVGGDAADSRRGMDPLGIPDPCEPLVAGFRHRDGVWYSLICHGAGRGTLFGVRPVSSLAIAAELPCTPVGVAPRDGGVLALARCEGRLHGAATDAALDVPEGRPPPLGARSLICLDGRPRLAWQGGRLTFAESEHGFGPLLPGDDDTRRAVWTGQVLLSARLDEEGRLSLERWRCHGDTLEAG